MGANVLLISYLKQPRKSNTILNSVMIQTIKYSYDSYHDEEPRRTQFFYEYVMILSDIRTQELVMDLTYSHELAYHGNNELEVALCLKKSIKDTQVLTWVNDHFNRGIAYHIKKFLYLKLVKPCCFTPSKLIGRFCCCCETGKEWILSLWSFAKGLIMTAVAYYDVLVDLMFVYTLHHVSNKLLVSHSFSYMYIVSQISLHHWAFQILNGHFQLVVENVGNKGNWIILICKILSSKVVNHIFTSLKMPSFKDGDLLNFFFNQLKVW